MEPTHTHPKLTMQSQGFLQSKEWAEFQRSLEREVFEYEKEGITAKIIKHDLPLGKNYLYIPNGPEMDPERGREGTQRASASYGVDFNQMTGGLKNPVANFVSYLRDLGRKEKSIFIKAEPLVDSIAQALAENKFKKSKKEIQPGRTVIIDLIQDDNELLAVSPSVLRTSGSKDLSNLLGRMHHKTRYNIKVAEGHGIKVAESHDTDLFLKLLKKTTKRDKFSSHPDGYYRKLLGLPGLNMRLFLAYSGGKPFDKAQGKPIAGAIILIQGDAGYYLHGASDYEHRALMAPYALHWQIIKYLKQNGAKHYDMWGIDANKWPGVTRFKLGWGGRTIEYPGSFDLPISKFWYLIYKVARKLF